MSGAAAESVAAVLLLASIAFAVARPHGLPELVVAGPAAVFLCALGIEPLHAATATLRALGPTVAFLAAILVFGHLCADAGVFRHLGAVAARLAQGRSGRSRQDGPDRRLLGLVVGLAAGTSATLTLDATVVLLTPVVRTTARRLGVPGRPPLLACTRLANSGSLLLPVSNLTNLLAFGASGLSFGRFTALMALPWVVVCVGEWAALRIWFRADLSGTAMRPDGPDTRDPAPTYALVVLAGTVLLFALTSSVGVAPAWAAAAGCIALLVPTLRTSGVDSTAGTVPERGATWWATGRRLVGAASVGFCLFVLALAVVVDAVTRHGLADALGRLLPGGASLPALFAVAGLAALLAHAVNNLPATLALTPLVAGHPAAVLAMLIGVNVGPNATYPGSLATLLWRRLLPARDRPSAAAFHAFGLATVPILLAAGTAVLWAASRVLG